MENGKLCQDPIHRKILITKRKLQEDDDYEPEAAVRYAVKTENILYAKPLPPWVMMNLGMMEMMEVNKTSLTTKPTHLLITSTINDLSPLIMGVKMSHYPPKMSRMSHIFSKMSKNRGWEILFSLVIYTFWNSFWHLIIPPK